MGDRRSWWPGAGGGTRITPWLCPHVGPLLYKVKGRAQEKGRLCTEVGDSLTKGLIYSFLIFALWRAGYTLHS